MARLTDSERIAENLVPLLISYLPQQSSDVYNEYCAGEFVPAAHGAIHDLGILRTDLPYEIIKEIGTLIESITAEGDSFNSRFLSQIKEGYKQLHERFLLISNRTA